MQGCPGQPSSLQLECDMETGANGGKGDTSEEIDCSPVSRGL